MTTNNKGFTLIETVVSILLLSIVLAAGLTFYFNSSDIMTRAMRKKVVLEMATQAMEQMKNSGYAGLQNPGLGTWGTATTVTFGDFSAQKQTRVTDVEGTSPHIDKKVEIKISWTEPGNPTPGALVLATYMTQ